MPKYPMLEFLWIVPLLPLLGSAVNGFFGAKWPNKIVNWVATGSTGLSFLGALEAVREFFESGQVLFRKEFFAWIAAGNFRAGFDLQMDQLTVVRSEEHTSELQSQSNLVCRLLLEKKKTNTDS